MLSFYICQKLVVQQCSVAAAIHLQLLRYELLLLQEKQWQEGGL